MGPRLAERAQIVLAWLEGTSQRGVARRFGTTPRRVRRWCQRALEEGPEGLVDRPRSGAPVRAPRARAAAAFACGASTYEVARRCGISQPTASRLRRELELDPASSAAPPPRWRAGARAAEVFVAPGHRVLLLRGATPRQGGRLPDAGALAAQLEAARREGVIAGKSANVRLRRFLRRALRSGSGPLVVVATSPPTGGPAVRKLVAGAPRLRWYRVATQNAWARLVTAWRSRAEIPGSHDA